MLPLVQSTSVFDIVKEMTQPQCEYLHALFFIMRGKCQLVFESDLATQLIDYEYDKRSLVPIIEMIKSVLPHIIINVA